MNEIKKVGDCGGAGTMGAWIAISYPIERVERGGLALVAKQRR